jgi:hypothetical protein
MDNEAVILEARDVKGEQAFLSAALSALHYIMSTLKEAQIS